MSKIIKIVIFVYFLGIGFLFSQNDICPDETRKITGYVVSPVKDPPNFNPILINDEYRETFKKVAKKLGKKKKKISEMSEKECRLELAKAQKKDGMCFEPEEIRIIFNKNTYTNHKKFTKAVKLIEQKYGLIFAIPYATSLSKREDFFDEKKFKEWADSKVYSDGTTIADIALGCDFNSGDCLKIKRGSKGKDKFINVDNKYDGIRAKIKLFYRKHKDCPDEDINCLEGRFNKPFVWDKQLEYCKETRELKQKLLSDKELKRYIEDVYIDEITDEDIKIIEEIVKGIRKSEKSLMIGDSNFCHTLKGYKQLRKRAREKEDDAKKNPGGSGGYMDIKVPRSWFVKSRSASPGEPFFDKGFQWYLQELGFPDAWSETKGDGIKIALIDDGVHYDHPDLKNNLLKFSNAYDFYKGDDDPSNPCSPRETCVYHGTRSTGLVVAEENGSGMIGGSPQARIMPYRVANDFKNASTGRDESDISPDAVTVAIKNAAQNTTFGGKFKDVADVILLSLTGSEKAGCPPLQFANFFPKWKEAVDFALKNGVPVVVPAGNTGCVEGTSWDEYFAKLPGFTIAGAITRKMERASYSNISSKRDLLYAFGGITDHERGTAHPLFTQILSTIDPTEHSLDGVVDQNVGTGYDVGWGTSWSAGQIASLYALIKHVCKDAFKSVKLEDIAGIIEGIAYLTADVVVDEETGGILFIINPGETIAFVKEMVCSSESSIASSIATFLRSYKTYLIRNKLSLSAFTHKPN